MKENNKTLFIVFGCENSRILKGKKYWMDYLSDGYLILMNISEIYKVGNILSLLYGGFPEPSFSEVWLARRKQCSREIMSLKNNLYTHC